MCRKMGSCIMTTLKFSYYNAAIISGLHTDVTYAARQSTYTFQSTKRMCMYVLTDDWPSTLWHIKRPSRLEYSTLADCRSGYNYPNGIAAKVSISRPFSLLVCIYIDDDVDHEIINRWSITLLLKFLTDSNWCISAANPSNCNLAHFISY